MPLYVYQTPECHNDAETHSQNERVQRFAEKVEKDQHAAVFDRFLPTPFLKKVFGKSFRLLAIEKLVGDDQVICFLRFFARGGNGEYDSIFRSLDDPPASICEIIPDDGSLADFIARRKETGHQVEVNPSPNLAELAWLEQGFAPQAAAADDLIIFETPHWVEAVRKIPDLYVSLQGLVAGLEDHLSETELLDHAHGVGILFRHFPALRRVLLVAPLARIDAEFMAQQRRRFAQLLNAAFEPTDDELLRLSARSYPLYLGLDRDIWVAIQRDQDSNLALSPEETTIIDSVRAWTGNGPCYPLFINGRAGSGKSTMIQYLVSDYLEFALKSDNLSAELQPLYLTCSEELLQTARAAVAKLLTTHHERILHKRPPQAEVDKLLSGSFRQLREYLLGLLPAQVRQKRFRRDQYVNYASFGRLWDRDMGKRPVAKKKLSPDLTWHTIRTYIKGMRFDAEAPELGPDEYAELPRKQQSVTQETFKAVFQDAWEGWYRPLGEQNGHWDDQDLAVELLRLGQKLPSYPAMFCDEAQDFTRVELELLFRLSLFSRRIVPHHLLRRVPFVFAGDPFQTLNPTGFRWDSIQASFHEKFIQAMDDGRSDLQGFNYQELLFNYRSTEKIVKLCNLIQLLRATLFSGSQVKPQESWRREADAPLPSWFNSNDATVRAGLRQSDLIIIVNCDEGEEDEYVRNDPLLNMLTEKDEKGVARNVYSPIRAKGLEFQRVALYKFGDTCPADLLRRLSGDGSDIDPDRALPLEYFFNRLYVAASRAKRRLFVVDTEDGLDKFWGFARNPDLFWQLIGPLGDQDSHWRERCAFLMQGNEQSWSLDRENPRQLAQLLRQRGRAERAPYYLRQARLIFDSLAETDDAQACLGEALEQEGDLAAAGKVYRDLGRFQQALSCFWKGGLFESIPPLGQHDPRCITMPEYTAARFMAAKENAAHARAVLPLIAAYQGDTGLLGRVLEDSRWHEVIGELAKSLAKLDAGVLEVPDWRQAYRVVKELTDAGFKVQGDHLAELAYRSGRLADAVAHWEQGGLAAAEKEKHYHEAKAELESFPQRARHLRQIGSWRPIIEWWESEGVHLPEATKVIADIVEAYVREKQYDQAVATIAREPREDQLLGLLQQLLEEKAAAVAGAVVLLVAKLISSAIREQRWGDALELASRRGVESYAQRRKIPVKLLFQRLPNDLRPLETELVKQLAKSATLGAASTDTLQRIFDHVRDAFSRGGRRWEVWREVAPLPEAGAAVERTGKIVDALEFYENIEEKARDLNERQFAQQRLVRCKEKRAELLYKEGRPEEGEKAEREAKALRDRWHIEGPLPDVPDPEGKSTAAPIRALASQGKERWQAAACTLSWSGEEKRLRIYDNDNDRTAFYFPQRQQLYLETEPVDPDVTDAGKEWRVRPWGLLCRLVRRGDGWVFIVEKNGQLISQVALSL